MKKIILSMACIIGLLGFVEQNKDTSQAYSTKTDTVYLMVDPGTH
ncbi:ABC transporter ATP-binding protein [Bacillus pseudomycoides]|uniref:ABC transporter ATP-binding protein n=1 Tax=Bacillus bingmayongensis TaxID=1150157 RepID=A0ABU5JZ59_9BACI|nr:ABC transporter ATP-binding protein [Bacillus pseudomycoides]